MVATIKERTGRGPGRAAWLNFVQGRRNHRGEATLNDPNLHFDHTLREFIQDVLPGLDAARSRSRPHQP